MTATVLRADDARAPTLLTGGWRVVGESWGARLRLDEPPDLARFERLVERARRTAEIRELHVTEAAAIATLEADTHADFPVTPATPHHLRDAAATAALLRAGFRAFGAVLQGRLLAVTIVRAEGESAETDVTAVTRDARRQGLAAGVKAASVLVLAAEGVRTFGTGGAAINAGSLAMNRAVGYTVEERWLSLAPPADGA
ncbi:acetyltransferase [Amnibacterium sp.]|uniref:acetyltransferase n=1 Tax=Amnibacterium sp. TaxID=1872496 RepID=UPI00261AAF6D|nr:acetyltransferase [Amnibacterium sp.]MCU1472931.1 Uncharacterized protein [Amnibacterium sp.]